MVVNNKEKLYEILVSPVVTEKTTLIAQNNQFVFKVLPTANKEEIKESVEFLFNVKVKAVNVINQNGKWKVFKNRLGKRNNYKKAIVTLSEGQTIDIASGV